MQTEIVHLPPLRTANILALVYGFIAFCFWAPFGLFFWWLPIPAEFGHLPRFVLLGASGVYPLGALIVGWLAAFTMAVTYNFVTRFTGGIRVDLRTIQGSLGNPWNL